MLTPAWISGTEILLALLVGLLVFGGRLPEVLKDAGRWFFRLRRQLEDIRKESGLDETLRELRSESRRVARDLEESSKVDVGVDLENDPYPADPHAAARVHDGPPEEAEVEAAAALEGPPAEEPEATVEEPAGEAERHLQPGSPPEEWLSEEPDPPGEGDQRPGQEPDPGRDPSV